MTNLGDFAEARLRVNSITLSNSNTSNLNVKNFRFSNIDNNVFDNFDNEQLIKSTESYTFITDLNMNNADSSSFDSSSPTSNINIKTNFNTKLIEYNNDISPTIYNGFSYYNKNIENITHMSDWIKIKHKHP